MKINIYHIDTCLPDYFGGHHKAHLQVPVDRDTSIEDLRLSLLNELYQGAVAGSDPLTEALSSRPIPDYLTADEADEIGFIYSQPLDSKYIHVPRSDYNLEVWKDYCDKVYEAAVRAAEELPSRSKFPFQELDPVECEDEQVYAYFILEVEEEL